MRKKNLQLSIVVPVYNESAGITKFHQSLSNILALHSLKAQIIYVDDGSVDDSPRLIKKIAKKDKSVKPLFLSKNFGKEAATSAGIHASLGDATIIIDADGQHPVELIPNFVNAWKDGCNVVVGVRKTNQKEGIIKKIGSQLFYTALKLLGVPNTIPGTTDYSLIDREVANAFNNLTEHNRITRSLIDWLGYRRKYIYYNAKPREYGNASYSTKKLISLAMNGFISLSFKPLYFSGYLGVLIVFLSFIASCLTLINKYVINDPLNLNVTGTALLAMLIISLVGFLMIGQGLLALYIARIYSETQDRPLYIVKNHEKH